MIARDVGLSSWATRAPDGTIVFVPESGGPLLRLPAAGGTHEVLAMPNTAKGEIGCARPEALPGNRCVMYALLTTKGWSLATQALADSTLFEVNAIAEDDRPAERQPGRRAVPGDELSDRVVVGTLATGRGEAGEHRALGVLEVREGEDALGWLLALPGWGMRHTRRPPVRRP